LQVRLVGADAREPQLGARMVADECLELPHAPLKPKRAADLLLHVIERCLA
jgi:hypothetical protein